MEERSPYAPPASDVKTDDARKGAAWLAVLLGLATAYIGALVFGVIFGAVAATMMVGDDGDMEQFTQMLEDPLSPVMMASYLIGALFSILGGYICARFAKHKEMMLGGVMAVFSILVGIFLDDESTGPATNLLLNLVSVATLLLGAWLGMKRNQRQRASR